MSDLPITTTLLLDSLKDERNNAAWSQFDARYRRVLEDFARSAGLRDDDAAEIAQQTLVDFVKAYRQGRYSRLRGRLHSWIIAIAQNKVVDCFRAKARGAKGGEDSAQGGQACYTPGAAFDPSDHTQATLIFDQHLQQAIFSRALDQLRAQSQMDEVTIKAFELVSIRGVSVEAAARECGMKASEVYVAKHRVLSKLRTIVATISQAWEE